MAQRRFVAKLVLSCTCANSTSAEDGPRAAEGLCGAHVGRVVAVEGKDGEFSVGIEGAVDGRSERGMEGPASLRAEGDVRFKRFSTAENIPYSARRARISFTVPNFGRGLEKKARTFLGRKKRHQCLRAFLWGLQMALNVHGRIGRGQI